MTALDRSRWPLVSPVLDELLDLPHEARAARLAGWRLQDPAWADELAAWLAESEALDVDPFMAQPALRPPAGLAGRVLGAYTLERELGQGGMGSVWLARRSDGRFDGQVAVKCLRAGLLARGDVERFEREGRLLARLQHPNIARLLDAGVNGDDGQPYLVLEYVDGEPIDAYCTRQGLDVPAVLRLFLQVLAAVAHAHSRLILHRDLKPSNVLVTAAGEVKLLDFGIGRLLGSAEADGDHGVAEGELTQRAGRAYTLHYAAPEQIEGGDVSTATDVHALGVLLFLLLSGLHPTRDRAGPTGSTLDTMRAVIEADPGKVSAAAARAPTGSPRRVRALRGDLDLIVAKALKKRPAERYANAQQLADDLNRHLDHEPIAARSDSLTHQLLRFVQRHRLGVAAGAAVVGALVLGIGLALREGREAARQHLQAEGLIEFMLSDLPGRLRPVGRLDALDAVGERALAHYAAQDAGALDSDALSRRARALHLIGEIASQRGQTDRAAQVFQQAAQSTAELLARAPNDGQRLYDHAQSAFWVGQGARLQGHLDEAEAGFRQYLVLARRLAALAPERADWRIEEAYAQQNLGVLLQETARPQESLRALDEAVRLFRPLVAQQPALNADLVQTLGTVAWGHEELGDYAGAIVAMNHKAEALARVPDVARNQLMQFQVAVNRHELGRMHLALGDLPGALASARAAREAAVQVAASDRSNSDWQVQSALAALSLAEIEYALGRPATARADVDAASAVLGGLLGQGSSSLRWQVMIRGKWLQLRARTARPDERPALLTELDRYLEDVAKREAQGGALNSEQRLIVAMTTLLGGDLHRDAGHASEARSHWRAAADRLTQQGPPTTPPARAIRALALARLGQIQEAQALADTLAASTYRHPTLTALQHALARP